MSNELYWRSRRRSRNGEPAPAPRVEQHAPGRGMPARQRTGLDALLDRYKNLIYSIPVRYGAPPQDAADIFQAVCLDLFNELPRLRDADALQGWLIRVTTNKCYHWKRSRPPSESDRDEGDIEVPGRRCSPCRPTCWRSWSGSRWCAKPSAAAAALPRDDRAAYSSNSRRCRTPRWRGGSRWPAARSGSSAAAA